MGTLDDYDERKKRAVALFASSVACANAVRKHIDENQNQKFDLVLVDEDPDSRPDGPGLSEIVTEMFGPDCFYAENIGKLPANVGDINLSDEVEPTILISVSKMVWFRHWAEPVIPDPGDGSWIFATYATIGSKEFGLPLECYDEEGTPTPSPIGDTFAELMQEEFSVWEKSRREFTDRLKSDGVTLVPDTEGSLILTKRGTSISVGSIDLPLDLMWRLRRYEKWIQSHSPWDEWTDEEDAFCDKEGKACAKLLGQQLGVDVKYRFE